MVSRWVRDERVPRPDTIDHIADVLGVDVDYALTMAGHRPATFEVDPESPEGKLIPIIRRIHWTDERLYAVEHQLRFYLDLDEGRFRE